jgi:predicted nucleic acid-binding protein
MNSIPCDSSSLISLGDNCILRILENMNAKFVIPKGVKIEVIDAPLSTKRFKLRAIQMDALLKKGVLQVIDDPRVFDYAQKIADLSNRLFEYGGKNVKIIHHGEAEVMACAKLLNEDTILSDERTTRHLLEDPDQLKKYMQARTGLDLKMDEEVENELAKELNGMNVIRSAEIFAYAYEKRLMPQYATKQSLEAGLYAVKFSGCSITDEEIREYIELID